MSAPDGAGTREVARRLFAAEYDAATMSYSESDEERAPNYVVTPTGARVNRLFAVGVLTATESVNEDMLRARIVDPTGAFVAYAGQYQPDALAFLERADPPAFVALTGKARTFQPEDSEQVFTSARPETVAEVDADTRDRWTVSAAEATLRRVSLFDAALSSGLRDDDLEAHLREHGVEEALAAGVPRAIDHYGTTTAYLEAVRELALDALAVVAGDREEVRELSAAPDEGGAAALGPIPADLRVDQAIATPESAETSEPATTAGSVEPAASPDSTESTASADGAEAAGTTESADSTATADAAEPATSADTSDRESAADAEADASGSPAGDTSESTVGDASTADSVATETDTATERESESPANGPDSPTTPADDLGDFEDTITSESGSEGADADESGGTETAVDDVAEDDLYEFDEEEREAVREEHGLSFESGAEVDAPGEAGIETPDVDDLESEPGDVEDGPSADVGAEGSATAEAASGEPAATTEEPAATTEEGAEAATEATSSEDAAPDEIDADELSDAVVEVMGELDEGDGVDREKVVAAVVQRSGADPEAVDDAIQQALMDGKCYEPGEGRLKAI
jgi:hypothetical protein